MLPSMNRNNNAGDIIGDSKTFCALLSNTGNTGKIEHLNYQTLCCMKIDEIRNLVCCSGREVVRFSDTW